jgi:predicted amidohydrolase YtcJ
MSAAVLPGQPDVPKMSPEQALTVAEAIKACTTNTARSLLVEEKTAQ